jgi:hypothetical protein
MREVKFILGYRAQFTENGATYSKCIDGKYTTVECEQKKGWFHGFLNDTDMDVFAVIEDTEGFCCMVSPHQMRFVNNPDNEDKANE